MKKLLKIPVIIDEEVRNALKREYNSKLDVIKKAKLQERETDHFIEKYRKNNQRIENNKEALRQEENSKKIDQ